MSERITVNEHGAKPRQIDQVVGVLVRGGLIAYPTDSGYALGWRTDNRQARDRVIRLRQLNRPTTSPTAAAACRMSGISRWSTTSAHRMIRQLTPGPYTFILPATSQVPRTVKHAQPDHRCAHS